MKRTASLIIIQWWCIPDMEILLHVCIEKHERFSGTLIFQSILHAQTSQHTLFLHVRLGIQHLNASNSSLISFLLLLYTSKNQLMWNSSCP